MGYADPQPNPNGQEAINQKPIRYMLMRVFEHFADIVTKEALVNIRQRADKDKQYWGRGEPFTPDNGLLLWLDMISQGCGGKSMVHSSVNIE